MIRVQETAANAGGGDPATSAPTARVLPPPPANTAAPQITGTSTQGQALTTSLWPVDQRSPDLQLPVGGLRHQRRQLHRDRRSDGPDLHTDRGRRGSHPPRAVSAHNAGGTGGPATSPPTAVVAPPPPVNSSAPSISGKAVSGDTVNEKHGVWSNNPHRLPLPVDGLQLLGAACTAIAGATAQAYKVTPTDQGHTLEVQEWASNAGGTGGPVSSPHTNVVP